MDMKRSKRFLLILAVAYWVLAIMIYAVAHEQFRYTRVESEAVSAAAVVGEITDGITVRQNLTAPAEQITDLEIRFATYGRQNSGTLNVVLQTEDGQTIAQEQLDLAQIKDNQYAKVVFEQPTATAPGEYLVLVLTSQGCAPGNAVTVYSGNSVAVGRAEVAQTLEQKDLYTFDGMAGAGKLCARLNGYNALSFYRTYWFIVIGLFAVLALYSAVGYQKAKKGKYSGIVALCVLYCKYQFLIKQLVSRDFKVKYKRSVLGIAWSFLNPLLTMAVQYVVFSTLFKSDVPNYPVYLLSGIVLFNFFNEAVTLGMLSITSNAALIKKVYVPKYIYPITRLASCSINFVMAMVPLFAVMLLTGTALRASLLLLIFDFICLFAFILGMILLMSTAMVFFQDMQFLWGVLSMIWMYLTPIIYPETIIPGTLLPLYRMNPMYQYVSFARTCIIDGVSPAPDAYLGCILTAGIVLLIGALVFKRNQDKFVLSL